jgi:hypothetical protein
MRQYLAHQVGGIASIRQNAYIIAIDAAHVEIGQHTRQSKDRRARLRNPGSGQPLARIDSIAKIRLFPWNTGDIM